MLGSARNIVKEVRAGNVIKVDTYKKLYQTFRKTSLGVIRRI
tara:strand:- start:309 stop:434 length:126 start_codon:yes stop_codon:yes gene_type:complete